MTEPGVQLRYKPPPPGDREPCFLGPAPVKPGGPRYLFHDRLEIGRDDGARPEESGVLLVADPTVSRVHCVLTQDRDGRCFVRDLSRNGTRLDGRRLVPNVENPIEFGQVLQVGSVKLALLGEGAAIRRAAPTTGSTIPAPNHAIVTVLVGDIRDYTHLVRLSLSREVQAAVSRTFELLSAEVAAHGGTVKEYQGDALLAFWEGDAAGAQAPKACAAALALDRLAGRLGADRAHWPLEDFPLRMDWALATGFVLIDSFGRGTPTGLSMMGEPIVRAFRIEKFATEESGRILACGATEEFARAAFAFRDLGERLAKGFDAPDHVFSLLGPRGGAA
ncbi:MAG: adenylate/guanylate cyclase domain-containing protein [Anaeromyxobacter sp.]